MNKINSFSFYKNYFDLLDNIKREDKMILLEAIVDYMFKDKEPILDGLNKAIWTNIRMPLTTSKKRAKVGKTKNKSKDISKLNQNEIKSKSKEVTNNISTFLFLISNYYISNYINNKDLTNYEIYILDILNQFVINEELKAREVQLELKKYLEQKGFEVKLEEVVESNGSGEHTGRIDLIAKFNDINIAIEYDNVSPRYKSVYKVSNYNADLKIVMLRGSDEIREENGIFIIGTSLQKKQTNKRYLLRKKIEEWVTYKFERNERYKETGLKSLLTQIDNNTKKYGEEKVIDLITECMANNYKGIIFEKLKKEPLKPTSQERRIIT